MTFEQAIQKSIKQYFKGWEPEAMKKANNGKPFKYNKSYFDGMEKEFFGSEDEIEME